ncbi:MAG: hypothetical protein HOF72_09155, partial [Planctomycetaceae bacterium]|nr:hypothetical protein [Planctomycetaceae bacterium]
LEKLNREMQEIRQHFSREREGNYDGREQNQQRDGNREQELRTHYEQLLHKMEDVKNVYRKAQEDGNEGQALRAGQYLEKLTAELHEIRQHFSREREGNDDGRENRSDHDNGGESGERVRHLQAALEHLHAGGFGDLAQMIERKVDEMHRQDDRPRPDQDDRPSRDELENVVEELGQQLENLGRELQRVRRALEESNR